MKLTTTTPLTFTLMFCPTFSVEWPAIRVYLNDQLLVDQPIDQNNTCSFVAELSQDQNQLRLHYYNKSEAHTIINSAGAIESDQFLELTKIYVNDILLGSWLLTEGYYFPDYFKGFLLQVPDAPSQLKSQLIWHFPGIFCFPSLPNNEKFWWWYRNQRRYVHTKTHQGKDDYRDEAYVGSLESHQELIDEIKKIINV